MVKSVEEEPVVVVTEWGIMQDEFGFRLVGILADSELGRVTSPIVTVDVTDMTVVTESGRIYCLRGPEDTLTAARVIHMHLLRTGQTVRDAALADFSETVLALAPKPKGELN